MRANEMEGNAEAATSAAATRNRGEGAPRSSSIQPTPDLIETHTSGVSAAVACRGLYRDGGRCIMHVWGRRRGTEPFPGSEFSDDLFPKTRSSRAEAKSRTGRCDQRAHASMVAKEESQTEPVDLRRAAAEETARAGHGRRKLVARGTPVVGYLVRTRMSGASKASVSGSQFVASPLSFAPFATSSSIEECQGQEMFERSQAC
ncbi:hypothetical protein BD309DRAFT_967064 [Dichomitus squalens]|nr:hypothetical protein BD309DRAFT_967064 [Dichomitus squalens]